MATFLIGIYTSRFLGSDELGIYALFYSAFVFASMISTQLPFAPMEIYALNYERDRRTALLTQSVGLAIIPTLASLLAVGAAALFAPRGADRHVVFAMLVTTAATTIVSPIQNHVRRLLHLSARSWAAATVSVVQLITVVCALIIGHMSALGNEWTPFGALAASNIVSLSLGVRLCRNPYSGTMDRVGFAQLRRSGGWLLLQAFAASGTGFVVSAVVANVVGAKELGYAEAARIVAQPLFVLFMGLSAVLGPRSMEAAAAFDRQTARRVAWVFNGIVVGCGALYIVVAGLPWRWNPVMLITPVAFAVPGLAVFSMLAEIARGVASPYRSELLGARREPTLAGVEIAGGALRLLAMVGAPVMQAFVVPVSFLAMNVSRIIGQNIALSRHYGQRPTDGVSAEGTYQTSSSS